MTVRPQTHKSMEKSARKRQSRTTKSTSPGKPQLLTIRPKGQITLSATIRKAAHLEEGDPVTVEVMPDGAILLRPMKLIDASQAWFWSEQWQKGEKEASEDIRKGRTTFYASGEDLLKSLK